MDREQYLRIPYLLVMESFRDVDGIWYRRAYYPELPDAVAEAASPIDALDQLEEKRVAIITDRLERGLPVPVPRPPLH
jgi:predicted RNase H-like HicB family nuclease